VPSIPSSESPSVFFGTWYTLIGFTTFTVAPSARLPVLFEDARTATGQRAGLAGQHWGLLAWKGAREVNIMVECMWHRQPVLAGALSAQCGTFRNAVYPVKPCQRYLVWRCRVTLSTRFSMHYKSRSSASAACKEELAFVHCCKQEDSEPATSV
jgi:hypothetical protein